MTPVTDKALLAQLDGPDARPVTDERLLFELENGSPQRTIPERITRGVGLAARAGGPVAAGAALGAGAGSIIPGVGTVAGAGAGAAAMTIAQLFDKITGANSLDWLMDKMGLPSPENATERIASDVGGAMAGQGAIAAGARLIPKDPGSAVSRIADLVASKPGSQIAAAGSGAAGASTARESGMGPTGQTVAGLVAGVAAPVSADVAQTAARATARGVRAAVEPFTQAGRERVVGTTMKRLATDPKAAEEKLLTIEDMVTGSKPTTAQAARDEGLHILERGVASASPRGGAQLARRASEQNQARNILLNSMAGDEAAVESAKGARNLATTALREGAFASKKPVDLAPVLAKLDAVSSSPAGKRQTVADAMSWLKGRLEGVTDPEELYAIRQDIGDVLGGKLQGEKANLRLASGQLIEVRSVLDEAIEAGAPGFKKYLSEYASQSKPINQMETLQDVRGRVLNAGTDAATGERIMSAPKFYNAVTKAKPELAKVLNKEQMGNLDAIAADLDRSATSASSGKAAGSNTMQNVSTAYVLGQAIGKSNADVGWVKNLSRPLQWLNKLNEGEVQDLLVDAMLDPALARSLMSKANPRNLESLGFELKQRAAAMGFGGTVGTARDEGKGQ